MADLALVIATREALACATGSAKELFERRSHSKSRSEFHARGKLEDKKSGAVYVYYDHNGQALYVGQTGRGVKERIYIVTSPHRLASWWPNWQTIKFFQESDLSSRLVLEMLLILALKPLFNRKPRRKELSELFA